MNMIRIEGMNIAERDGLIAQSQAEHAAYAQRHERIQRVCSLIVAACSARWVHMEKL